ncbi:MAG: hypothetical protein MZV63_23050 [Marinilabiliales bacterium]|nr:hypothetical protein [Marinilabiliales bacterium]
MQRRGRPDDVCLFGRSWLGFGMIMIFILQMTAGNIYILSAVVLTLLMAGLAAGACMG